MVTVNGVIQSAAINHDDRKLQHGLQHGRARGGRIALHRRLRLRRRPQPFVRKHQHDLDGEPGRAVDHLAGSRGDHLRDSLGSAQLDAAITAPDGTYGAVTYTPTFGTILTAGTQTLTVNVAPLGQLYGGDPQRVGHGQQGEPDDHLGTPGVHRRGERR